jgi:hypothetical protein
VQGNAAFQGFPQDLFLFLQALAAGFYVHLANDGIFFGGGVWLPPAPVPRYNITPAGRHPLRWILWIPAHADVAITAV